MQILNPDHCKICENKIIDFSKGTLCSLTNEGPDFSNKCHKIVLKNEFEKQIAEINIEHDSVLKSKTNQIGSGVFNLILSLLIFFLGVIFTNFIFEKGYISTFSLIILVIASIPFVKGIGIINSYFNDLKIAKKKKERLDKVASIYGYDYKININHIKDSLENIEHEVNLKVFKIPSQQLKVN